MLVGCLHLLAAAFARYLVLLLLFLLLLLLLLLQVQEIIDDRGLPEDKRPPVAAEVKGTATWGNALLRCSCCTGKTNRSKQQQQQMLQQQQQMQGDWQHHDASDPWGDKIEDAAAATEAATPAAEAAAATPAAEAAAATEAPAAAPSEDLQQPDTNTDQQQQQQQFGECCCCCELLSMGDAAAAVPQHSSKTTWSDLVEDLKLLDKLTVNMRSKRNKVYRI